MRCLLFIPSFVLSLYIVVVVHGRSLYRNAARFLRGGVRGAILFFYCVVLRDVMMSAATIRSIVIIIGALVIYIHYDIVFSSGI